MKNNINLTIFVISLLFSPFFAEGKSAEGKSFIQEIKEKITKEKEKVEEKSKAKEKKEDEENNKYKDKNEVEKPTEEESRIKEVKDKIAKEEKKIEAKVEKREKEKKKEKDKNKHDHDYVSDRNRRYHKEKHKDSPYWIYDDINFDVLVTDVRYDDYPYIYDSDLISPSPIYTYKHPRKIVFLNSSVEAAYLGKDIRDTYGVTAKISANLYYLHFNCFYQNVFSSEEKLTIYSINGGFSFALDNFTLTPFIGAFYIEPLEEARFSYGANLQIFFPENYNLDLYTLNSSYGSLNFNNFSASLNYKFYRFNFGLGFNYNNYAGVSFSGPLAKLSFWL